MFIPKFDIMNRLKECGYNSTRILREKVFGQSVTQDMRCNKAWIQRRSSTGFVRYLIFSHLTSTDTSLKKNMR